MYAGQKKYNKPPNPRATCNFISVLTFSWTLGLFREGIKRELEVTDLYEPLKEHSSGFLGDKLEVFWNEELDVLLTNPPKRKPSYLRAILRCFGPKLFGYGCIVSIVECSNTLVHPILLGQIISYFERNSKTTYEDGLLACLKLFLLNAVCLAFFHLAIQNILHVGMKVRVASCALIYRKALRLSKTALGETTIGQIVNLLSNDVNRFDNVSLCLHYLWLGPLLSIVVTYFLIDLIGLVPSFFGIAVLLIFIPFQLYLGRLTAKLRLNTALQTDDRVRLMNEIISGIQVIKMYTWEKPFSKMVSEIRKKEMSYIRSATHIRGILLSFNIFHTRIAIFCSILAYVLSGYAISAQKVFVMVTYFGILRQSMSVYFPQGIGMLAEAMVSIRRVKKFLLYDETRILDNTEKTDFMRTFSFSNYEDTITSLPKSDNQYSETITSENNDAHNTTVNGMAKSHNMKVDRPPSQSGIIAKNIKAKWLPNQNHYSLNDLSFEVKPGKLVAVIGPVGSSKSSLFQAILRELPLSDGSLEVTGTISYASQEPWLFAGSVRSNILFGLPMDKTRYKRVIKVCALITDFEQMPMGDRTMVGDKGVSLSGGQRARINLARAIYKNADVYLLDDPLSAVDSHVGKHLFELCITGFLQDKTVMLITHQIQYLTSVDHVILLRKGSMLAIGTMTQLQASGFDFTKLLELEEEEVETRTITTSRQSSTRSNVSSVDEYGEFEETVEPIEEMRSVGGISSYVYKSYFSAGGSCCFIMFMFLMFFLAQLTASGSDYWITYWINIEELASLQSNRTLVPSLIISSQESELLIAHSNLFFNLRLTRLDCISIFTIMTISMVIFTIVRSASFVIMCTRASLKLHNRMFENITQGTMYFFNNNSVGRILNRFSKDIGAIDELLPQILIDLLQIGLSLIGIITVVGIVNYWLMLPTLLLIIIFYILRVFYLSTSRSVKRLEGITRSPVFSHLAASLNGLTTIRAFKAQPVLIKEFDNHQDLHSTAWYLFLSSRRAFAFWLDIICLCYITSIMISFFFVGKHFLGADVGLAITQAFSLTGMFQWGMRQSAEFINQMTSVERVLEYHNVDKEPPLESSLDKKPPSKWPEHGKIEFNKVFLRYGPGEPLVLKNLNFTIQSKEKVGIVGRTGAGKSTLIQALFRLAINEGSIKIDGIETSQIGLHDLRSKISIIPQEPVLFSGNMRKNLDPFDEFPDHVLWNALEETDLKNEVKAMAGELNSKMSEGGSNFSVGQRQLVCLARAIIRNNRVLIMDEATANVDPQTDVFIQRTIREKFAQCTVLTIAHRLNTVMDSDKVLVMDSGRMVEFDHPYILLKNRKGIFYSMVEKTGKTTADHLHRTTAENYNRKYYNNLAGSPRNTRINQFEQRKDV